MTPQGGPGGGAPPGKGTPTLMASFVLPLRRGDPSERIPNKGYKIDTATLFASNKDSISLLKSFYDGFELFEHMFANTTYPIFSYPHWPIFGRAFG